MGAVHLSIPVDLFEGRAETAQPAPLPPPRSAPAPVSADIQRALTLLRNAERPVVIAGSGLWWADAGAPLARFLRRTRLPYYSITMARGVIPDSSPSLSATRIQP